MDTLYIDTPDICEAFNNIYIAIGAGWGGSGEISIYGTWSVMSTEDLSLIRMSILKSICLLYVDISRPESDTHR